MLSPSELEVLTLRASAVHHHAAFPYFEHEINGLATQEHVFAKRSATSGEEPRMMKMPPYLNFFVRYKPNVHREGFSVHTESGDGEKGCRWSRVVRVRRLCDVQANKSNTNNNADQAQHDDNAATNAKARPAPLNLGSQSATGPAEHASAETFVWRKKVFWVCLEVEGEVEPISLSQLSNKPPTMDEVAAYCERHAEQFPDQLFTDTPVADDAVLARHVDTTDRRVCLPTAHQIQFLETFWSKVFVGHSWTEAELNEAKALNRRYLPRNVGAAAGPVTATLSHLGNLTLETNLGLASAHPFERSNMRGSHAALRDAQSSVRHRRPHDSAGGSQGVAHINSTSSPLLWTQASTSAYADTQDSLLGKDPFMVNDSSQVLAPETEALSFHLKQSSSFEQVHTDAGGVPRSPFLPRKRLRSSSQVDSSQLSASASQFSSPLLVAPPGQDAAAYQQQQQQQPPLHGHGRAAVTGHNYYPVSSMELLGGSQSNGSEGRGAAGGGGVSSMVPSSLTPPQPTLSQAELRAWEDARQSEDMFYNYVTNTDRSRFINMLAGITQRNIEENRRTRLIGIENEKRRVHRGGNFEEGGLAAMTSGDRAVGTAKAHVEDEEEAPAESAVETVPELTADEQREQALALFDTKAASELSFDVVPDDLFLIGDDVDAVNGNVSTIPAAKDTRIRHRRAGANPNMLVVSDAERQDPSLVCSQLVHRSASNTASSVSQTK